MDDYGEEIPERRKDDRLVNYRLKKMEEQQEDLKSTVDSVKTDVADLKEGISNEFADLRKTLFERPVFVTYEIMKIELESRDRVLQKLEKADGDSVTTTRHYVSLLVMVAIAIVAPVLVNKLLGIP